MKKIKIILFVCISFASATACTESQNDKRAQKNTDTLIADTLSFIKETPPEFKTPESVKYDAENQRLYVANINGNPTDKDGNGFISIMSFDGKLLDKEWVTGLNAPKGMGIFGDNLYVSDIDRLIVISIKSGKIISTYPTDDAEFLNDIDVDKNGNVYVSDMASDRIFRLQGNDFSVWCKSPEFVSPNGLYVQNENLLVGTKNKIVSVDILSKEVKTLIDSTGSIDGLEAIGKNQLIFSDWSGHIHISKPDGNIKLVLNTAKNTIQAADIEYCKEKDIILVPTFFHNTISFYKLMKENK